MTDCITMIKYQGLGNDYLVLDPSKNQCKILSKIVKGKVISISSFASIKNIKIY